MVRLSGLPATNTINMVQYRGKPFRAPRSEVDRDFS